MALAAIRRSGCDRSSSAELEGAVETAGLATPPAAGRRILEAGCTGVYAASDASQWSGWIIRQDAPPNPNTTSPVDRELRARHALTWCTAWIPSILSRSAGCARAWKLTAAASLAVSGWTRGK